MSRLIRFFMLIVALAFTAPAVADTQGAKHYAEDLGNKALAIAGNKTLGVAARQGQLETLFKQSVDIPWVGKFVLGKYWKQATPEQQKNYMAHYETFVIKHYTSNFAEYTNESFKVTNVRDDGDNEYTLSTEIVRPGKENVFVDYRMRESGKSYKIFDIIVEGVSLITTQRSEFGSVVAREGMDHLIDQLAKRSEEAEKQVSAKR